MLLMWDYDVNRCASKGLHVILSTYYRSYSERKRLSTWSIYMSLCSTETTDIHAIATQQIQCSVRRNSSVGVGRGGWPNHSNLLTPCFSPHPVWTRGAFSAGWILPPPVRPFRCGTVNCSLLHSSMTVYDLTTGGVALVPLAKMEARSRRRVLSQISNVELNYDSS